jgi:hypothetical protein
MYREARFDPSGTQTAQTSYTADVAGNQLRQSLGGQAASYSYNTLDQLTSTNTNLTRGAATTSRGVRRVVVIRGDFDAFSTDFGVHSRRFQAIPGHFRLPRSQFPAIR